MRSGTSPRQWLARTSAAVLATAILAVAAQAGTFTIVDLPATGTDAAIGIDATKEYTHTFDFGSGTVATVNGVAFEQGLSGSITAAYTGTSKQGYGWTITDTRAAVSIAIHAGNDPVGQCDGDSTQLLYDMIYHSGSTTIGAGAVLILSDLKPGITYSTRYYYRSWSGATADRTITCQGDGGHNGDFSDVLDVDIDGGGSHYLDYTFTADDTDVTIRFLTNDNNNGVHLYAVTNEVLSAAGSASLPSPSNGSKDVLRDVQFSWTPDVAATSHNVYLGTSFDDVSAAAASTLVSEGQSEATFDPGRLEFGQTYYWRVDEVGASVVQGNVWSFTVEPLSYAVAVGGVTATASSSSADNMGPDKTIDGSGLDASDQHSTSGDQMWLSNKGDAQPWIQYEFTKAYRLDKMLVWNSNQPIEAVIGFGAKAVKVEVSLDGQTWTAVGDFEFAKATGQPTYTANTTVDFAGAAAKFVKLTISSNWGGVVPQYGLSEVRFFQIPTVAREPRPASGTTGLAPLVSLSWKPGREAASHQVFVGTDVNDLTLTATVTEAACELDNLTLGQTYYWKVVEVNEAQTPSTWDSDVWSFTTNRAVVVEDFESYDDNMDTETAIFQTWLDGYDVAENGSIVGYSESPFAEQTIVFGKQSMPFAYDNTGITYSEAERTFDTAQDWTKYGVKSLSLYFAGKGSNTGSGKLYVKINSTKVVYTGASSDLTGGVWMPGTIDLASTGANRSKVTKLVVGVEGSGATGALLFDNICLFPSVATTVTPADPG
ncbi:MAG: discoidin domain-containing protein, partial [Solirubrobacterales bacterium]